LILIHGFWLDGSSWDALELEDATALTLPRGPHITLRDHVDAVVAAIDAAKAPVTLVAHSGGAAPAHAAVDMRPSKVARVFYVDAVPPGQGEVVNAQLPIVDGEIPLPDWSVFDAPDLVDLDREAFAARALPTPARVATDPQQLSDERRYDVPVTVICCEFSPEELQEWMAGGFAPELARIKDVSYVHLPTGHWPQFTRPRELAALLS